MKPGWQTTEFWLTLIAAVQPFVSPAITPEKATAISAALVAIYSIARAITKRQTS